MNEKLERRSADPNSDARSFAAPKAGAAKGSRSKKISRRLVVASAMAVLAVYAAGYGTTQSDASQIAAKSTPPVAPVQTMTTTPSATTTSAPTIAVAATTRIPAAIETSVPSVAATSTPVAPSLAIPAASATGTSSATSASPYKDGTYIGAGMSRHGGIQATVVIQGGKIVLAQITGSSTRYPTSHISSLPGEVVSAQSTNVHLVSGATDSSTAYLQAVANALAQAA